MSGAGEVDAAQAPEGSGAPLSERLVPVALRGLRRGFLGRRQVFAQTLRGRPGPAGPTVEPEGESARYTAIALLGLARTDEPEQKAVLEGRTVRDLLDPLRRSALDDGDPGALALAAWAWAEIGGEQDAGLVELLARLLRDREVLPTVDCAWMLTAATAGGPAPHSSEVVARARARLLAALEGRTLFPHALPADSQARYRRHVGCFADQVYPLQALARLHRAQADPEALDVAEAIADELRRSQGPQGQWWWFYDSRTGDVVERFPVYSVHQHGMAPMVLADLRSAGGTDHTASAQRGLAWLDAHPEVVDELVSERLGVVWRKVGRREPRKLARGLTSAVTARVPGARVPGLDRLMPPVRIDHECRPYELGWLLYAAAGRPGPEEQA